MRLFDDPVPPTVDGIDLRCCDVAEVLTHAISGCSLVFADPPWDAYNNAPGMADPALAYPCLGYGQIRTHLSIAYDVADAGARLVLWSTWPLEAEIRRADIPGKRWKYKTGGAWVKTGAPGVGHHWTGNCEPVRIYVAAGSPYRDSSIPLRNGHVSQRHAHSAKPIEWQAGMIRRWTRPGDLVLDLYAGTGSVAAACVLAGRRYLGAEVNPERHQRALGMIARTRSGMLQ